MTNRSQSAPLDGDTARQHFYAAMILLLVALLLGGVNRNVNHLAVELAALPLFYLLVRDRAQVQLGASGRFALGAFAVALLQLVPLPPALWTALPGRELAVDVYRAAGMAPGWRPMALDPGAAALALATLVPALILFIGVRNLPWEQRRRLLGIIAAVAFASALLGVGQRLMGIGPLYQTMHRGFSTGLFVNRNHQADLILAGVLLLPALVPAPRLDSLRLPLSVAVVMLGLAVTATTSRMGLLLAMPAVLLSLALVWRPPLRLVVPVAAVYLVAAVLVLQLPVFAPLLARLGDAGNDDRAWIADTTLVASRAMWPVGSGYGSFVPVYAAYEDLDRMAALRVVAAHNDFLQIILEGGLGGLLTILGALGLLAHNAWRLWSRDGQAQAPALAWAAFGCLGVLLLHSLVDFPMRMAALMALFATCAGASDAVQQFVAKGRELT
ncbi:MAG: O-antigen ligase family protein [Sphingomonadales bacterium]|nr:O-antigen ligase family protein [Sphingomonadales bacterium]